MNEPPDITLWRESTRHLREHTGEAGDIWRHEGLKKAAELSLYIAGRHQFSRSFLEWVGDTDMTLPDPRLATNLGALALRGPVGISAGWDKPGRTILGWQALGAEHITVGGVTLYPQSGNRMVRLRTFDHTIGDHGTNLSWNALGFNSGGADKVVYNIAEQRQLADVTIPVVVQVTLNKEMYEPANRHLIPGIIAATVRKVKPVADAVELGLTSPNTLGMRDAQDAEEFTYTNIMAAKEVIGDDLPLSFKGDGDGGEERLEMYCRLVERTGLDIIGLINTTSLERIKARYGAADLPGGLAGADPEYQQLALDSVRYVYEAVGDKVDIVGMGGINSPERALRMIKAGASAVGINTAVRRLGPRAMSKIENGLLADPTVQAVGSINELIGADTERGPKPALTK